MKQLSALFVTVVSLTGCAKLRGTNTSIWSEIFWIPWLLGIIAAVCWYKVYKAYKSGSGYYKDGTNEWVDTKGKGPVYKTWFFVVAVVLTLAVIAMIIGVYGSR
jgi:hypothetical protein